MNPTFWELKWAATIILKQQRLGADITVSGSRFLSGVVHVLGMTCSGNV